MSTVESTPNTMTPTTMTPTAMTTTAMTTTAMTTGDVVELETHANWRAGDIGDVEEWTLRLTGAHHDELDAALAHARSVTDEVLDVTADDFPLPTLAPLLAELAQELVNGRGFARIACRSTSNGSERRTPRGCTGASACTSANPGPRTRRATCSAT